MTREEKIASARKAAANLARVKNDVRDANSKAAKPKAPPAKANPSPPTKYQQLRTLASGVMGDVKGAIPGLNKELNDYRRKKIDEVVEGKAIE